MITSSFKLSIFDLFFALIGIGLNLKFNPSKEKYNWPTQNLFNLTGKEIKPYYISLKIIKETKRLLEILLKNGFEYIRNEWKKHADFIGKEVISSKLDNSIHGVFDDIGDNGEMLIRTKELKEIRISSRFLKVIKAVTLSIRTISGSSKFILPNIDSILNIFSLSSLAR